MTFREQLALKYGVAMLALTAVMMPHAALANPGSQAIQAGPTAAVLAGSSQDLTSTVGSLQAETATIPNAIAWFSYVIGVGFTAWGIMKLKAHADNAAQNKLGPALGVLTTGAAFLAFPGVTAAVMNSAGFKGQNPTFAQAGTFQ